MLRGTSLTHRGRGLKTFNHNHREDEQPNEVVNKREHAVPMITASAPLPRRNQKGRLSGGNVQGGAYTPAHRSHESRRGNKFTNRGRGHGTVHHGRGKNNHNPSWRQPPFSNPYPNLPVSNPPTDNPRSSLVENGKQPNISGPLNFAQPPIVTVHAKQELLSPLTISDAALPAVQSQPSNAGAASTSHAPAAVQVAPVATLLPSPPSTQGSTSPPTFTYPPESSPPTNAQALERAADVTPLETHIPSGSKALLARAEIQHAVISSDSAPLARGADRRPFKRTQVPSIENPPTPNSGKGTSLKRTQPSSSSEPLPKKQRLAEQALKTIPKDTTNLDSIAPSESASMSTGAGEHRVPKTEQRSPSLSLLAELSPTRRLVTEFCSLYRMPDNCKKTYTNHFRHRQEYLTQEINVLRRLGFQIVKSFFRDDGMVIEWTSKVPVWSDTLLPEMKPMVVDNDNDEIVVLAGPPSKMESRPFIINSQTASTSTSKMRQPMKTDPSSFQIKSTFTIHLDDDDDDVMIVEGPSKSKTAPSVSTNNMPVSLLTLPPLPVASDTLQFIPPPPIAYEQLLAPSVPQPTITSPLMPSSSSQSMMDIDIVQQSAPPWLPVTGDRPATLNNNNTVGSGANPSPVSSLYAPPKQPLRPVPSPLRNSHPAKMNVYAPSTPSPSSIPGPSQSELPEVSCTISGKPVVEIWTPPTLPIAIPSAAYSFSRSDLPPSEAAINNDNGSAQPSIAPPLSSQQSNLLPPQLSVAPSATQKHHISTSITPNDSFAFDFPVPSRAQRQETSMPGPSAPSASGFASTPTPRFQTNAARSLFASPISTFSLTTSPVIPSSLANPPAVPLSQLLLTQTQSLGLPLPKRARLHSSLSSVTYDLAPPSQTLGQESTPAVDVRSRPLPKRKNLRVNSPPPTISIPLSSASSTASTPLTHQSPGDIVAGPSQPPVSADSRPSLPKRARLLPTPTLPLPTQAMNLERAAPQSRSNSVAASRSLSSTVSWEEDEILTKKFLHQFMSAFIADRPSLLHAYSHDSRLSCRVFPSPFILPDCPHLAPLFVPNFSLVQCTTRPLFNTELLTRLGPYILTQPVKYDMVLPEDIEGDGILLTTNANVIRPSSAGLFSAKRKRNGGEVSNRVVDGVPFFMSHHFVLRRAAMNESRMDPEAWPLLISAHQIIIRYDEKGDKTI